MKRLLLLSILLLPALPKGVIACGEPDPPALGSPLHPDSAEEFFLGNTGIVLKTYEAVYLAAAYKLFSAGALTDAETNALNGYLESQSRGNVVYYDPFVITAPWKDARKEAVGDGADAPGTSPYADSSTYDNYLVCNADAFTNAAALLAQRVSAYGAGSKQVKDWVAGQDAVFSNCTRVRTESGEGAPPEITVPEPTALPDAVLKKDRAYQTAAAYFYGENYKEARRRFREIAADKRSVYAQLARYLVVRTYIREAFKASASREQSGDYNAVDPSEALLKQAEAAAIAILNDPGAAGIHAMTGRLLNLVQFRTAPKTLMTRLGAFISSNWSEGGADWNAAINDYSKLVPFMLDYIPQDDLTDWILSFSGDRPKALEHSVAKWRKTGEGKWLLAALANDDGAEPDSADLMAAAAAIPVSSKIYASVAYQRLRLFSQKDKEAAELIAGLRRSAAWGNLPAGSRGLIRDYALNPASTLNEYLATFLHPDFSTSSLDRDLIAPVVGFLNTRVPLSDIKGIIEDSGIPGYARRAIFVSAWVRALTLADDRMALALARAFRSQKIDSLLNFDLDKYLAERTAEGRAFRAAAIVLKNPRLNPVLWSFNSTENYTRLGKYESPYWTDLYISPDGSYGGAVAQKLAGFSQSAAAEKARLEVTALLSAEKPIFLFGKTALEFAKKHPRDPDVPEALYDIYSYRPNNGAVKDSVYDLKAQSEDLLKTKYKKQYEKLEKVAEELNKQDQ